MRVAAITDIHGNLPALEAVLAEIDEAGVDEIWCLGDVLGYGVQPDACTDLVRERCDLCLVGNHDLAVLGSLDVASFSEAAAAAVLWTQDHVEQRTLDFLGELEPAAQRQGIGLAHASPRDPIWEYVLSIEQAEACMEAQEERIGLIGHSHVALFFSRPEQREAPPQPEQPEGTGPQRDEHGQAQSEQAREPAQGAQAGAGTSLELSSGSWLLNPGSVGQPRDGDPRAAWLELDTELQTGRFHRVSYPIELAAQPIEAAGLPPRLAERLYAGL